MALDEVRKLWNVCFPGISPEWMDLFFRTRVQEDDLLLNADARGTLVSALLLEPYLMTMWGQTLPVSYLSFAATAPKFRGLGNMHGLLHEALHTARGRGDVAVWLIPGADWLYGYYAYTGQWATVAYSRDLNYTSVHHFDTGDYMAVENPEPEALYDAFSAFEHALGEEYAVVLHSRGAFDAILADCRMDGGDMLAVSAPDGAIAGVAVAVPDDFYRLVHVKAVMGIDEHARDAALEAVRRRFPDKRIMVSYPPDDDTRLRLTRRGMVRITNVLELLDAVGRRAPKGWRSVIKVTDPVIDANTHTYLVEGARGATVDDDLPVDPLNRPDFDVSVNVLATLIFGSPHIGALISLPAQRPLLRLMLE